MAAQPPQSRYYLVYRYSGLGCTFAAAVLLFMAGGWVLDRWLGLTPIFTLVGALVGLGLASVNLYQKLRLGGRKEGENREGGT
jgi:F0F1-type ATP synthase assembly protein I